MNSDVAVTFRHYGTHQSGQVARDASRSSRDRVIALSLLATMVVAAVCCVVLLSPAHQTALESDQDSINDLLNKIDKLTASQSASPSAPAPAHAAARLAQHAPAQHLRLNVESPEQKFLDEVNGISKAEESHSTEEPILHIPKAHQPRVFSSSVRAAAPDSQSESTSHSPTDIIKALHKEDAASNPRKLGIPSDPSSLSPAQKAKVKAELEKVANALKSDFKSDVDFANKAGYLPPIPGHPGV